MEWGSSRVVVGEAWRWPSRLLPWCLQVWLITPVPSLGHSSGEVFPRGMVSLQPLNGSSLYLKNFPNRFIIFSITLFHNMMSESENLSEGNVCVKVNAVPCVTRV